MPATSWYDKLKDTPDRTTWTTDDECRVILSVRPDCLVGYIMGMMLRSNWGDIDQQVAMRTARGRLSAIIQEYSDGIPH